MRAILLFLLLILPIHSFADCVCERQEGDSCSQGYCVHPGGSSSVLYYFHGMNGSLENWTQKGYYPNMIRRYWEQKGLEAPTVVSVSYGPEWLLASKNTSSYSGLFEDFELRMRPKIEASLGREVGKRMLLGESMGAFNSLQLALRTSHYDRAAILCAVLAENFSLDATEEQLQERIRASSAYQYYGEDSLDLILVQVTAAIELAKAFYPTQAEWQPFDPLELAKNSSSNTSFYLASGFYDEFAAFEGNEKLAEILRSRGRNIEWRPQWGGHCAIDIPSVAEFLVK